MGTQFQHILISCIFKDTVVRYKTSLYIHEYTSYIILKARKLTATLMPNGYNG